MPQQDTGPEQRSDSSVGLDGAASSNGATSATFGAPPFANGAANIPFLSGSGPKEKEGANKNGAARPSLDTALTGIGRQTTWQDGRGGANSSTLEYFRRIYLSLQSANSLDTIPTIGITSALDGEGKSTIALGISTAIDRKSVV